MGGFWGWWILLLSGVLGSGTSPNAAPCAATKDCGDEANLLSCLEDLGCERIPGLVNSQFCYVKSQFLMGKSTNIHYFYGNFHQCSNK